MSSSLAGLDKTYVYLNTGSGWLYASSWTIDADQFSLDYNTMIGASNPIVSGHNVQVSLNTTRLNEVSYWSVDAELHDITGDGIPDIVQSYRCLPTGTCMGTSYAGLDKTYIYQANYTPLVLTSINFGSGGSDLMVYKPVTAYTGANNSVPYVVQVLDTVKSSDGFGTFGVTAYSYSGGTYYYDSSDFTTRNSLDSLRLPRPTPPEMSLRPSTTQATVLTPPMENMLIHIQRLGSRTALSSMTVVVIYIKLRSTNGMTTTSVLTMTS